MLCESFVRYTERKDTFIQAINSVAMVELSVSSMAHKQHLTLITTTEKQIHLDRKTTNCGWARTGLSGLPGHSK